eukprot:3006924-Rhodomonas_salina.4
MGCTVLTSCVGWAADGEMKGQDVVLGKLLRKSKNSEGGDEGGEGEKRPTGRLSCGLVCEQLPLEAGQTALADTRRRAAVAEHVRLVWQGACALAHACALHAMSGADTLCAGSSLRSPAGRWSA